MLVIFEENINGPYIQFTKFQSIRIIKFVYAELCATSFDSWPSKYNSKNIRMEDRVY